MGTKDDRETWGSRVSFLLACIGYAVGLGNIWRFPYNAYKSGGGAFLVPYFIMLLLCGIPLLFMELAVGQYTRRGPIGALDKLCPILKGAGVGTVVISFFLCTYYNVILSWAMFYLSASFQSPLPWATCHNWWNTDNCFNEQSNSTQNRTDDRVSATQEFFDHRVLQRTEGLRYFFYPDWNKVCDPKVWVNAASQVFNSVGIAFGSLIAFSSYNKFRGPVLRDTLIVTLVDAFISLLCGCAVFAVLGNLAHQQGKDVDEVVADGPGLVFVVFPHALSQMPYPQVWSVVFFCLILFLGVDSQFATVEVIVTSIKDGWEGVTKYKFSQEMLVLIVCVSSFLCGLPHILQGGIYTFNIIDYYSATISLMYIAFFETVAIVWCYGASRLAKNVADMTGSEPSLFFRLSWKYSAPTLIGVIWVLTLVDYKTPSYGEYDYPAWCHGLGWLITLLSLAAIPVMAILEITKSCNGSSLLKALREAAKSKISHCPCCGTKLNESKRAHSDRSLSCLLEDEDHCQEDNSPQIV